MSMKSKKNEELNFLYLDDKYANTKKKKKKEQKESVGATSSRPQKSKKETRKNKKKQEDKDEVFNFDNEIVIGVTKIPEKEPKKQNKTTKKKAQKKTKKAKESKGSVGARRRRTKKSMPNKKAKAKKKKESRKKTIIKGIIKWTILLSALVASFIFFMMSPLFDLVEIQVTGNDHISQDTIISLSEIQMGDNIYKNSSSKIKKNVKQNAYIDSVEVKRHLPNKIELIVKERKTTYMLEFAGSYAYINNQGYILEITKEAIDVPIIVGYGTNQDNIQEGRRLEQEDLQSLEIAIKIMDFVHSKDFEYKINRINIADKQNYTLYLEEEKKTVYIGDASNLNSRLEYTKEVLKDTKGLEGEIFVNRDMSIKEKAYFRPKQ